MFVRWAAARLDEELASGVSARASEALALRARRITRSHNRAIVASDLARALFSAEDAAPGFSAAQRLHQREVVAARIVIGAVANRLRAPEPVGPRGMAMLHVLLANRAGALFTPAEPGAVGSQLRAAAAALAPDARRQ